MEVLQNKRYLGLAGIVCLVLGTMLPYFKWTIFGISKSLSLIGYWEGYVIILAAIASALFIFKDYVEKYIPNAFNSGLLGKIKTANPKLVIIPVVIAALVAIYLTTSINVDKSIIKHGIGFWTTWIGVALLVAHVILYKGETGMASSAATQAAQPMMNNQMNQGFEQQPMQQPMMNNQMNQGFEQQPMQQPMMNNQMNQGFEQQSMQQPMMNNQMNQGFEQQSMQQPMMNNQMNQGFEQQPQQEQNMMNNQFPNNNQF